MSMESEILRGLNSSEYVAEKVGNEDSLEKAICSVLKESIPIDPKDYHNVHEFEIDFDKSIRIDGAIRIGTGLYVFAVKTMLQSDNANKTERNALLYKLKELVEPKILANPQKFKDFMFNNFGIIWDDEKGFVGADDRQGRECYLLFDYNHNHNLKPKFYMQNQKKELLNTILRLPDVKASFHSGDTFESAIGDTELLWRIDEAILNGVEVEIYG